MNITFYIFIRQSLLTRQYNVFESVNTQLISAPLSGVFMCLVLPVQYLAFESEFSECLSISNRAGCQYLEREYWWGVLTGGEFLPARELSEVL